MVSRRRAAAVSGSTLIGTWRDPVGDGQLRRAPGEPLVPRTELGGRAVAGETLATLAHVTDAHVLDASSPARVSFLDRLGSPFQSTFRPQEALTAQVLAGAAEAVRALAPDLVIQGGDLIDNDQSNELTHALAALGGGAVSPGSGAAGTSACSRPPIPTRSITDRTSTRHAIPGCCGMRSVRFAAAGRERGSIRCSAITTRLSPARSFPPN